MGGLCYDFEAEGDRRADSCLSSPQGAAEEIEVERG